MQGGERPAGACRRLFDSYTLLQIHQASLQTRRSPAPSSEHWQRPLWLLSLVIRPGFTLDSPSRIVKGAAASFKPLRRPLVAMRPLTEDETKVVFEKLHKFIGKNIKALVDKGDQPHCLRLQRNRVFYVREDVMRRATNVARDKLVGLGTCIGKFTHSGKFRLTIGALDVLSQYAKYKVWVKPSAEMQFLYGNHVLKNGLGRITENTPGYTGVVVYSMSDVPLGFGVTAKSTSECRAADPNAIVVFHQADCGEYLRAEDEL